MLAGDLETTSRSTRSVRNASGVVILEKRQGQGERFVYLTVSNHESTNLARRFADWSTTRTGGGIFCTTACSTFETNHACSDFSNKLGRRVRICSLGRSERGQILFRRRQTDGHRGGQRRENFARPKSCFGVELGLHHPQEDRMRGQKAKRCVEALSCDLPLYSASLTDLDVHECKGIPIVSAK